MINYKSLLITWFKSDERLGKPFTEDIDVSLKSAIPFIINYKILLNSNPEHNYDFNKPLDLPFKQCSFELSDNVPFSNESLLDENGDKNNLVKCLVVNENSPNNYDYWVYSENSNTNMARVTFFKHDKLEENTIVRKLIDGFLNHLNQTVVVEKTNQIFKCRTMSKNHLIRIKQVVRVYPKSIKRETIAPIYNGKIDYSHRWTVMGHWRSIPNRMGKNRENQPIENYTWIKDYIKGPENKILVKKTRIIDI
jgi:hypothetical protein